MKNKALLDFQSEDFDKIPLEAQLNVLLEVVKNVLDDGAVRSRTVRFKVEKNLNSKDIYKRASAINKIVSNGKCSNIFVTEENINEVIKEIRYWISECIARKFIESKIEEEVEATLIEKQNKFMDEVRLGIIKKQKGPENFKTEKKLEELKKMDNKNLTKSIQSVLRPDKFSEIVGQDRAIKALLSKIASPYPQHVILYGPPGVGKTTAARIALEEAKKIKNTAFTDDSKFVEVDGTTLRWDPREIANPLLGSVHDPIYQGSKRDLAETGIPEPKTGLVTDAHGGILFIDEIGELDETLQNKLLKVLEDKRVEFSSSYYDPDDESVPEYIKYLFENGAPADFVLVGATTREPHEINAALRSRCTEVYFEPLSSEHIEEIVINAAEKLNIDMDESVPRLISNYTIEGRRAVNILADAYGYVIYNNNIDIKDQRVKVTESDVNEVINISRLVPYEHLKDLDKSEVGHIYGLGVSGFLGSTIEIEAVAFKASAKGKGKFRFNETAGSMAKDSVFNAASVIRKITDKDIYDYDIHVNIVGGGKIDGPSAGAAITVCVISALLNKPIKQNLAVTGEISITGKVKPIGGVFEKIYGAKRKGITNIVVPMDNYIEVPKDVKGINVFPVDNIEKLLEIAIEKN